MTTKNIPNLAAIEQLQRQIDAIMAEAVRTRNAELQAEVEMIEQRRLQLQREHEAAEANAQLAERLRQQLLIDRNADINTERAVMDEELGQLAGILNPIPPAPAPIVVEPIAVPPIIPATPVPPTPAPTSVVPVTPPPPVAVRERSQFHPRNWTFLAWIFAFIGLTFAWNIVGGNWDESFTDSFASTLIWVGGLGLGFFIGGTIGQALALRLTPTPTPVVVAQPQQTPTPPPA